MHSGLLHAMMAAWGRRRERLRSPARDGRVGRCRHPRQVAEAELAQRLNVSRTPIREALTRLEGDGLVHSQGRGVRVRVLSRRELVDVLDARAGLEGWATARVASLVQQGEVAPARIEEIRRVAMLTDRLTRDGRLPDAVQANRRFHQRLAALADNPVIDETLDRWWDQIVIAIRHGLTLPDRVDQVDREHHAIIEAVTAGRTRVARSAVERHIRGTTALFEGPA